MCEFEEKDSAILLNFVPINLMGDMEINYSDKKLIFTFEKLSHDGYDKEGPESNLFDLYIISYKNNKYYMDVWHREDWFREIMSDSYELYERFEVNKEFIEETLKQNKVKYDYRTSKHIQLIHYNTCDNV